MKIAIIGAGNMGGAIARGLAQGSIIQADEITVANRSIGKLEALKAEYPEICITSDNAEATKTADMIILAVKPWLMETVMKGLDIAKEQIVV